MAIRNVLFIMSDQLRWDHLGCAGHPHLKTPHLDALARRGVRFSNAYVQSGICGPSRMSTYTGRYVSSHGATHNRVPLSVGEVTLGWHLRQSGRELVLCGKTHVMPDAHGMKRLELDGASEMAVLLEEGWFKPIDRYDGHHAEPEGDYADWLRAHGYDSRDPWTDFVIATVDEQGNSHSGWKMRNVKWPARVREEHSETAYTTERALEFFRQKGDQPWVLHLSYVKPHWPYVAPAPYHAMYTPDQCLPLKRAEEERSDAAHPIFREWQREEVSENFAQEECQRIVKPVYQGLISQLDHHLGRVFAELEALGVAKETLVVFCADHGDYLGDHWLGEKELFHDCIQKVPFIVVDPRPEADATRGSVDARLVESIDIVPTILEALGQDPASHVVEGRSLLPLLRGESPAWRDAAFSELDWTFRGVRRRLGHPTGHHHAWMVCNGRWKYVHFTSGYRPMLFDLAADPDEFHDLGASPDHQAVRDEMRERLLAWFTRLKRRTTLTWAEAELRTDSHKKAGVFLGEW